MYMCIRVCMRVRVCVWSGWGLRTCVCACVRVCAIPWGWVYIESKYILLHLRLPHLVVIAAAALGITMKLTMTKLVR